MVSQSRSSHSELRKEKIEYTATSRANLAGNPDLSGYKTAKGSMLMPFSFYTGSDVGGYQDLLNDSLQPSLQINNLHQDTYDNKPAPMQGPFTEKYVGGSQHRHIAINYFDSQNKTGSSNANNLDGYLNRPEGFFLKPGSSRLDVIGNDIVDNTGHQRPRANFFREEFAKRPLNIKNIQMTASSPTKMGNYSKRYEYFQTTGRNVNNLWFRSGS